MKIIYFLIFFSLLAQITAINGLPNIYEAIQKSNISAIENWINLEILSKEEKELLLKFSKQIVQKKEYAWKSAMKHPSANEIMLRFHGLGMPAYILALMIIEMKTGWRPTTFETITMGFVTGVIWACFRAYLEWQISGEKNAQIEQDFDNALYIHALLEKRNRQSI